MNVSTILDMSGKLQIFIAILIIYPLGSAAQGIDEIIAALKSADCYEATVDYQVLMSLQDDVAYKIRLNSMQALRDSIWKHVRLLGLLRWQCLQLSRRPVA